MTSHAHPFLLGDKATYAAAAEKAGNRDWARQQLNRTIRDADSLLSRPLDIPAEGGQWGQYYSCRKCGAGLANRSGKHVCTRCGATYTGWPYDQVICGRTHAKNWENVRTLGLAYQFTGREPYAVEAREILLAYADKYRGYPIHDVKGKESKRGGRLFAQTLDESVHLIPLVWGYDLIHDSPALSTADRAHIENDLLRPAAETILRNDAGVSNWQSWHNAAVAMVGLCIGDGALAWRAIEGKSGFRFQLGNSVLPDGFWYEGTPGYHFYALDALHWTAEAARNAGIDFYSDPRYRALYDAPLDYTFPDLTLPANNDSQAIGLGSERRLYELAYARWGDPRYEAVISGRPREDIEALLWGVADAPQTTRAVAQSRNFTGLGAAMLRHGEGSRQVCAHLDYGPHGGAHGHPDKLSVILYGLGTLLAPDPGSLAYSVPLHAEWYRQTIAHNTVAVDLESQIPASGTCTLFHSEPGFAIAQARCDTATTSGVRMRRTVLLAPDFMVDVFDVDSTVPHTWDWAWHNVGVQVPAMPTTLRTTGLGSRDGYQHISSLREAAPDSAWSTDFRLSTGTVRLTQLGEPGTHVYFGSGFTGRPPTSCPLVISRRTSTGTRFITLLDLFEGDPFETTITRLSDMNDTRCLALEIRRPDERAVLVLNDSPGTRCDYGGVTTTAPAAFVRWHGSGAPTQRYDAPAPANPAGAGTSIPSRQGGGDMSNNIRVEKVADGFVFPEGPVWHPDGYLIFSDVHGATIEKVFPEGGSEIWFSKGKKTNGMIMSPDGRRIYACCYSEREMLEIDPWTREYRVLTNRCDGREFNNVNDVAVDAADNVYFSDPNWSPKPGDIQGVYRYSPDGHTTLAAPVDLQPNGLVVSPDGQWLYVDRSGGHDIWRFRHAPDGTLSDGIQWVKLEPDAEPDGMTIDSRGNLYVAQAGNGKLCVLSPEGKVLHLVRIMDRMATNCEFAGKDEKTLYVTGGGRQGERIGAVYKVTFPG